MDFMEHMEQVEGSALHFTLFLDILPDAFSGDFPNPANAKAFYLICGQQTVCSIASYH